MQNKKLMLLPLVAMLTACGGSKIVWNETTKEKFAEEVDTIDDIFLEPYLNLKKSFTYVEKYKNIYEGSYDNHITTTYNVDFDGASGTLHIDAKMEEYYLDLEESEEPEVDNVTADCYLGHVKDVGVVAFRNLDGKKTYSIAINEEDFAELGETEEEIHEYLTFYNLTNLASFLESDFFFMGAVEDLLNEEHTAPEYWCTGAETSLKFFLGQKEGTCKGEFTAFGKDEDDISEGDAYVTDISAHTITAFENSVLQEALWEYKENGLYYETPEKSQKYDYLEFYECKTTKYKQPKLPSISGYTLEDDD